LDKNHTYYYQIQMQLLVSNLNSAYLVLYVPPDDVACLFISKDEDFLNEKMELLGEVYSEQLMPHFAKELFANEK
jgi:hypothetical protein